MCSNDIKSFSTLVCAKRAKFTTSHSRGDRKSILRVLQCCAVCTLSARDSLSYFIIFVLRGCRLPTIKFLCCDIDSAVPARNMAQHPIAKTWRIIIFLVFSLPLCSSAERNDEDDGLINNMSNVDEKTGSRAVLFNYSHLVDFVSFFLCFFVLCFVGRFAQPLTAITTHKQAVDKTNSQIHHLLSNIWSRVLPARIHTHSTHSNVVMKSGRINKSPMISNGVEKIGTKVSRLTCDAWLTTGC